MPLVSIVLVGSFTMRLFKHLSWVALLVCGTGCTASTLTRDIASAAPPAAIHAGLQSMNDRDNQRMMVQLLESPEMHQAARAFASEIADGTLGALTEPERVARIEQMSNEYVTSLTRVITRSLAVGLRQDLAPAIAVMMREAVGSTLHEVLREGYQQDMQRVAAGLTRATVDAATEGMADGVRRNIGPALQGALSDPQTFAAIGLAGRTLAREAVLGSNDAMTQIQRAQAHHESTFLGHIANLTTHGVRIFEIIAAVGVGLSLLLGAWVVRLLLRGRRVEAENERNAASALLFAEAMRSAEGKPWANELSAMLQQRLEGDNVGAVIDRVLGPRKDGASRTSTHGARHSSNGHGSWHA